MKAVSTSDILAISYQTTWRSIPEDSHLHTRPLENLKSYLDGNVIMSGEQYLTLELLLNWTCFRSAACAVLKSFLMLGKHINKKNECEQLLL
jgi:hypothetical protein